MFRSRRCFYQAAALALSAGLVPSAARGVIYYSTGDPTKNTTAPTGDLANSGWQYEANWIGFLATPVAPHYFLSAAHIAGQDGQQLNYNGQTYTTIPFADNSPYKDFGDLRLWHVDNTFYSFAPLYDSGTDGDETGKNVVMIGRGRQRGSEVLVGQDLKGWNWGIYDVIRRWGENKVSAIEDYHGTGTLLRFDFDAVGQPGNVGDNEATLAEGDSGGGTFINVNGQWKLAGINFAVSGPYGYTDSDTPFLAALFDTSGLYDRSDSANPTPSSGPSSWYASRVSHSLADILPYLDLHPTWRTDANGIYGDAGNWNYGAPPNGVDAVADFYSVISAPRTVTLVQPVTLGTLELADDNSYTIAGSAITMQVSSGQAQINVGVGSHTIASPIVLNSPLTIRVLPADATLSLTGALTTNNQTITKEGDGAAAVINLRTPSVIINAGRLAILPNGNNSGTSKVESLNIYQNGKLDLNDNGLVINYSGTSILGSWNGTAYTGVNGLLASGSHDGAWDGPGIMTSASAAAGHGTALAAVEASDYLHISGTQTATWRGQTVDATSVLIKYTYAGDANLDGRIDILDYGIIDSTIAQGLSGWTNGDFNYDGKIDILDYGIIDSSISIQGAPFTDAGGVTLGGFANPSASVAAVPEPAALFGLGFLAPALLTGRLRRSPRTRAI